MLLGELGTASTGEARAHLESCVACRHAIRWLSAAAESPATSPGPPRSIIAPLTPPGGQVTWSLGPYEILREIGRGGQGEVYLARDARLDRLVALKVLSPSGKFGSGQKGLERFRREAATLSLLNHHGICTIFDAGEIDGISYIAMRHVEGEALSRHLARGSALPPPTAVEVAWYVRVAEKVARALHCAHEAGVIHRDVKPGNILVTREGEPVLVDFGLARAERDGELSLTRSDEMLGTPAYVPPEALAGGFKVVDRRADVYSLGVTLYQCLTGHLPHEAASREALYRQILTAEAPDPRRENRSIPRDLKTVLETALAKDPPRRYGTALDFAEDLRRVRELEPILARPAGNLVRLKRWSQRHKALAASLLGTMTVLGAGLAIALFLLLKVSSERAEKEEALSWTQAALERAESARLAAQSLAAQQTDPGLALLLAVSSAQRERGVLSTNACLEALDEIRELRTLCGHKDGVCSALWSRDGRWILSASYDRTAAIWDAATGECIRSFVGHDAPVVSAAFSPDETRVVTASWDATARIWDCATGEELLCLRGHQASVNLASWSPDGSLVLTASGDRSCALWSSRSGQKIQGLEGHAGPVYHAELSIDGARALTRSRDSLKVWSIPGGELLLTRAAEFSDVAGSASFSPDGQRIAFCERGNCTILEAATGAEVFRIVGGTQLPKAIFLGDGSRLAVCNGDGAVRILEIARRREVLSIPVDESLANIMAPGPDGSRILVQLNQCKARIYSTRTGRLISELKGHRESMPCGVFDPGGQRVATASLDHTIRIWRVEGGRVPCEQGTRRIDPICRSRDGKLLLVVPQGSAPAVYRAASAAVVSRLEGMADTPLGASFLPGDAQVALATTVEPPAIWDVASGQVVQRLGEAPAVDVAAGPNPSMVFTAHAGGLVQVWDSREGRPVKEYTVDLEPLTRLALSPDGKLLLIGTAAGPVKVIEVSSGLPFTTLYGHRGAIRDLQVSADGRLILTAAHDNTARLWSAASGEPVSVMKGHGKYIYGAELDGGGLSVEILSDEGVLKKWPVEALREATAALPRSLTAEEREQYNLGVREAGPLLHGKPGPCEVLR